MSDDLSRKAVDYYSVYIRLENGLEPKRAYESAYAQFSEFVDRPLALAAAKLMASEYMASGRGKGREPEW